MSEKTKNIIKIVVYSILIILVAAFGSVNSKDYYNSLNLPKGAPPSFVFPVAWGILYTLIIISASIIELKAKEGIAKKDALSFYFTQLMVNAVWPYLFFVFKVPLFSFVWLILLLVVVVITFLKFLNLNKVSGYLFIPYILWIIYAGYVNLGVALLQ